MLETIKIAGLTYFGIIQILDQDTNKITNLEKMHPVIFIQEPKFTVMCNTMQEEFFPSFRINQDSLILIFLCYLFIFINFGKIIQNNIKPG